MHADLAIAQPPIAERRGLPLTVYAFVLFVVLWSMHAFYLQVFVPRLDANLDQAGGGRDNPLYVGLWFLLYGAAAVLLLRDAWRRGIDVRVLALVPFAIFVLLSSLWADAPQSSLVFSAMFNLTIVVAAALAVTAPPRFLLLTIGWTIVALAGISLVLLVANPHSVMSELDRPGLLMQGSLAGVFDHKQALGLYAAVALLILIFLDRSRWRWRATGMAILVAALLLANAVTSLVGCVLTSLVFVAANRAGRRRNLVIAIAAAATIAVAAMLPFVDFAWLSEMLGRDATFTGRADFWKLAPGFIAQHPLLGYGYHAFFDTTPFSQVWSLRATELYFFTPNFHNTVLEVLIGLGLVGLMGYWLVLVGANLIFLNRTLDGCVAGTLSALMVFLTLGSATDVTFMTHNSLPTILLFYAFLVAGRDYGGARAVPAPPPLPLLVHQLELIVHQPAPPALAHEPAPPALAREPADTRIRSRRHLERASGHAVVASMPELPRLTFASGDDIPANAQEVDRAVSLLLARLRGRARRPGGAPLTLLVTSGDDARNKSALSLFLALCGTLDGQKVLLVDADPNGVVTQAVCGGHRPEGGETIGGQAVSHIDSFPGLRVISPIDGTAVEQLVTSRFLEEIKDSDLVVIDAPLLGSDRVTEHLIADNRIGAILFTASATLSTLSAVREAVAPIREDQRLAPVLCDEVNEATEA